MTAIARAMNTSRKKRTCPAGKARLRRKAAATQDLGELPASGATIQAKMRTEANAGASHATTAPAANLSPDRHAEPQSP
jgi:hypothetical protein